VKIHPRWPLPCPAGARNDELLHLCVALPGSRQASPCPAAWLLASGALLPNSEAAFDLSASAGTNPISPSCQIQGHVTPSVMRITVFPARRPTPRQSGWRARWRPAGQRTSLATPCGQEPRQTAPALPLPPGGARPRRPALREPERVHDRSPHGPVAAQPVDRRSDHAAHRPGRARCPSPPRPALLGCARCQRVRFAIRRADCRSMPRASASSSYVIHRPSSPTSIPVPARFVRGHACRRARGRVGRCAYWEALLTESLSAGASADIGLPAMCRAGQCAS
jgi:hypothetical protein